MFISPPSLHLSIQVSLIPSPFSTPPPNTHAHTLLQQLDHPPTSKHTWSSYRYMCIYDIALHVIKNPNFCVPILFDWAGIWQHWSDIASLQWQDKTCLYTCSLDTKLAPKGTALLNSFFSATSIAISWEKQQNNRKRDNENSTDIFQRGSLSSPNWRATFVFGPREIKRHQSP